MKLQDFFRKLNGDFGAFLKFLGNPKLQDGGPKMAIIILTIMTSPLPIVDHKGNIFGSVTI